MYNKAYTRILADNVSLTIAQLNALLGCIPTIEHPNFIDNKTNTIANDPRGTTFLQINNNSAATLTVVVPVTRLLQEGSSGTLEFPSVVVVIDPNSVIVIGPWSQNFEQSNTTVKIIWVPQMGQLTEDVDLQAYKIV